MNTAITLKTESSFYPADNTAAKHKRLVVLLHAYQGGPQQMQAIASVVRRELPDADMWVPRLQLSTFSWANPDLAKQSTSWKIVGYLSPLIWAGIIAIVVAIGGKIVSMAGVTITNYWALAAFVLYLWIAYLVVTKV